MTVDEFIGIQVLIEPAARLPKAFLAISYAAGVAPDPMAPGGELRVRAAVAMLTDDGHRAAADRGGTRVWLAGLGPEDAYPGPGAGFTVLLSRLPRGAPSAAELGRLLPDGTPDRLHADAAAARVLAGLTPPFAVVSCRGPDHPVVAATDHLGYRHLYWYQADGWAAVASSSLALACCAGTALDIEAMAVRSLLGFHLQPATPFAGVRKIGPGGICGLGRGTVRVGRYTEDPAPSRQRRAAGCIPELARSTAALLRDIGRDHLEQHPGLVLQLSGGLDSRIQLAAIPPQRRAGLRAITLDVSGSPDTPIARQLAVHSKLDHQVLPLDDLAGIDPAEAHRLLRQTAIRHDCSANPVAMAILDWSERQLCTEPRMHGMGGEFARGMYYPGQRQHTVARPALIARFARWRLLNDNAVDLACLGEPVARWARGRAQAQLRGILSGYRCDWLTTTDEFFLREQLARVGGLRLTVAGTERTLLGSLLHPDFIALARTCPPADKRSSRFMAMVLQELDPALAQLPLQSWFIPAKLAAAGFAARFQSSRMTRHKAASKLHQRLSRSSRNAAVKPMLAAAALAHWRREPGLLDGVTGTGIVDGRWLSGVLTGTCTVNPATIGFLANLQVIAEAMSA